MICFADVGCSVAAHQTNHFQPILHISLNGHVNDASCEPTVSKSITPPLETPSHALPHRHSRVHVDSHDRQC